MSVEVAPSHCSTCRSGKFIADHPQAAKGKPSSSCQWLLLPGAMALLSSMLLSMSVLVQNQRALCQKKSPIVSFSPKAMGSMNQVMGTSKFPCTWMLEHTIRILTPVLQFAHFLSVETRMRRRVALGRGGHRSPHVDLEAPNTSKSEYMT